MTLLTDVERRRRDVHDELRERMFAALSEYRRARLSWEEACASGRDDDVYWARSREAYRSYELAVARESVAHALLIAAKYGVNDSDVLNVG